MKERKRKRGELTGALKEGTLVWRIYTQEKYAWQREILRSKEARSDLKKEHELFIG